MLLVSELLPVKELEQTFFRPAVFLGLLYTITRSLSSLLTNRVGLLGCAIRGSSIGRAATAGAGVFATVAWLDMFGASYDSVQYFIGARPEREREANKSKSIGS